MHRTVFHFAEPADFSDDCLVIGENGARVCSSVYQRRTDEGTG